MAQVMNNLSYRKSRMAHRDVYIISLAIKFIDRKVETQISIIIEPHKIFFSLPRFMIFNPMDAFFRNYMLNRRITIILPKDIEALAICSRNNSQLDWEGESEEREDFNETKEWNCFDNGCIKKMMTRMGYKEGIGLGHCNQGPPIFPIETQHRKFNYGLGYRSTHLDDIRNTRIAHDRARAKANDIPFDIPMRPYPSSLNGQFVRAGENELFWGFKEAVIVASGWGDDT